MPDSRAGLGSRPAQPYVDQTPVIDYGSGTMRSAYGDPSNTLGNIGNQAQNFAAGAAKTAGMLAPVAAIPGVGLPLLAVASGIGGLWNAFTAQNDLNEKRKAEIETGRRTREAYLANKQFLTELEQQQLAEFDKNLARLEQNYQNQLGLQAGLLARAQQATQQAYGSKLGSVGMGYAAAQPAMMRGLAARGMLGSGAEAAARGSLASKQASDIATAMQNYNAEMAKNYASDVDVRSNLLGQFSRGQTALDQARANFNRALSESRFGIEQGNRQAGYKLMDQFRQDANQAVQQRQSDIISGATSLATSGAFQSALGAAFGPSTASTGGGLGMPESTYNKFMSGDYGDDEMARYYGYGPSPGGVTAPAPTVGPTVNATAQNFTEAGKFVPGLYANELPTSAENLARGGLWQAPMVYTQPSIPFNTYTRPIGAELPRAPEQDIQQSVMNQLLQRLDDAVNRNKVTSMRATSRRPVINLPDTSEIKLPSPLQGPRESIQRKISPDIPRDLSYTG